MPNSRGPISAEHAAWLVAVGYSSGNFEVGKNTGTDMGNDKDEGKDEDKDKDKDEDEDKDKDKNKDEHQIVEPPKKMFSEMPGPF